MFDIMTNQYFPGSYHEVLLKGSICSQPSTFWTNHLQADGKIRINEELEFCMDYDLWCCLSYCNYEVIHLDKNVSFFRLHEDSKTSRQDLIRLIEHSSLCLKGFEEIFS